MATAVFVPLAVAALLVFLAVLFVQRGREGVEVAPQTFFRAYLYVGSFAGVVALAFGAAALLNAGIAYAVGPELVYGGAPIAVSPVRPCPAGVECPPTPSVDEIRRQQQAEYERRRADDAVRGATFGLLGGLFWLVHWLARNQFGIGDQGPLQRAYVLIGTAFFGIATIVLLPTGVYQLLSSMLVPRPEGAFRQGIADSLTAGLVSLGIWLLYLRLAVEGLGGGRGRRHEIAVPRGPHPGPPPLEPSGVGAPLRPPPGERSAGAEAQPPVEGLH